MSQQYAEASRVLDGLLRKQGGLKTLALKDNVRHKVSSWRNVDPRPSGGGNQHKAYHPICLITLCL
jgi:hypothetical protein